MREGNIEVEDEEEGREEGTEWSLAARLLSGEYERVEPVFNCPRCCWEIIGECFRVSRLLQKTDLSSMCHSLGATVWRERLPLDSPDCILSS